MTFSTIGFRNMPRKATGQGGGRPFGSKSRHTVEREAKIAATQAAAEALLPQAFKGDAHALLIWVYKDESLDLETRLAAARAAIPYEKPRLATIDANVRMDVTAHEWMLKQLASVVDDGDGE